MSKATALALARDVQHAEARVVAAQAQWEAERAAQQAFEARVPRPLGRPPAFAAHIAAALSARVAAEAELAQAQARQSEARELIRALGVLYHPYDLEQGQAQPVARVAARFTAVWSRLKELAAAADLPNRACERLAKAERLTVQWLATLAFFFATVTARVEALALPPELEAAVLGQLIPALYLERVAARSTTAETRQRVQAASTALLERAASTRSSAAKSGARGERPGRRGRRRLRRSVPAQQLLCGRTQRPTVVASSWASSPERPQARRAHGRA